MPISAAIIGGGAALVGGYLTNQSNKSIAANTNATSVDLADTAMTRRVADLKNAGLNPALAYTQGGAAVPNLDVPTMQNAVGGGVAAGTSAYQAATQARAVDLQTQSVQSQIDLNKHLALKADADASVSAASAQEIAARTPTYALNMQQTGANIQETLARVDQIASQTNLNFQQTLMIKRNIANSYKSGFSA